MLKHSVMYPLVRRAVRIGYVAGRMGIRSSCGPTATPEVQEVVLDNFPGGSSFVIENRKRVKVSRPERRSHGGSSFLGSRRTSFQSLEDFLLYLKEFENIREVRFDDITSFCDSVLPMLYPDFHIPNKEKTIGRILMSLAKNVNKAGTPLRTTLTNFVQNHPQFMTAWYAAAFAQISEFGPSTLAMILYAHGELSISPRPDFLSSWYSVAVPMLGKMTNQELNNILYTHALLQLQAPSDFMEAWHLAVLPRLVNYERQGIVSTFVSHAKLNQQFTQQFLHRLMKSLHRNLVHLSIFELVSILKAQRHLSIAWDDRQLDYLNRLCKQRIKDLAPMEIASLLQSFVKLNLAPFPEVYSAAFRAFEGRLWQLDGQGFALLVESLTTLQSQLPPDFVAEWFSTAVVKLRSIVPVEHAVEIWKAAVLLKDPPDIFFATWREFVEKRLVDFTGRQLCEILIASAPLTPVGKQDPILPKLCRRLQENLVRLTPDSLLRLMESLALLDRSETWLAELLRRSRDMCLVKIESFDAEQLAKLIISQRNLKCDGAISADFVLKSWDALVNKIGSLTPSTLSGLLKALAAIKIVPYNIQGLLPLLASLASRDLADSLLAVAELGLLSNSENTTTLLYDAAGRHLDSFNNSELSKVFYSLALAGVTHDFHSHDLESALIQRVRCISAQNFDDLSRRRLYCALKYFRSDACADLESLIGQLRKTLPPSPLQRDTAAFKNNVCLVLRELEVEGKIQHARILDANSDAALDYMDVSMGHTIFCVLTQDGKEINMLLDTDLLDPVKSACPETLLKLELIGRSARIDTIPCTLSSHDLKSLMRKILNVS